MSREHLTMNEWKLSLVVYNRCRARWRISQALSSGVRNPSLILFSPQFTPTFLKGLFGSRKRKMWHFANPLSVIPLPTQPHLSLSPVVLKIKDRESTFVILHAICAAEAKYSSFLVSTVTLYLDSLPHLAQTVSFATLNDALLLPSDVSS